MVEISRGEMLNWRKLKALINVRILTFTKIVIRFRDLWKIKISIIFSLVILLLEILKLQNISYFIFMSVIVLTPTFFFIQVC